jgi:hypothetical protein
VCVTIVWTNGREGDGLGGFPTTVRLAVGPSAVTGPGRYSLGTP